MKRLFELRDSRNIPFQGIPAKDGALSFETKKDAKDRRDEINRAGIYDYPLHVSPGRDHHNYKGSK